MKRLLLLTLLAANLATDLHSQNTIRIVPLGNSITHGDKTHFSYRYNLWSKLKSAGLKFDFVGTMSSNYGGNPPFPDPTFDKNHEGHRGWRADQIVENIPNWLQSYTPDMVLLHIGTNDVFMGNTTATTVSEIKSIIDEIRKDNPDVTIFLAKIIGTTASVNNKIVELNNHIDALAAEKNSPSSRVIVVDQYAGFDPATDAYDGKHPNSTGEEKMAMKWFGAIRSYCQANDNQSPSAPADLSSSTISQTGFSVSWTPSKDFIGVYEYEVFKNNASAGVTKNTSFDFTSGIDPATTYAITVRARDAAGNWSPMSNVLTVTTQANPGAGTGLKAAYYNALSPAGTVVLTRTDPQVNFNWGTSSPGPGVSNNFFSVRWTGSVLAPVSGNYIFSTTSDDGINLWVNGQLAVSNWTDHGPTTNNSSPVSLVAGKRYDVKIEYYENNGGAVARFLWSYPGQSQQPVPQGNLFPQPSDPDEGGSGEGTGLHGAYFNGTGLSGAAILTRVDPQVSFDFAYGSPGLGVNTNYFSARWQGEIEAPVSGNYTFTTLSDDGVRLWIDGVPVIDNWSNHKARYDHSNPVLLTGGHHYDIKLEYFEGGGSAVIKLFWAYPGQDQQTVPQSRLYPLTNTSAKIASMDEITGKESIGIYPNPSHGQSVFVKINSMTGGQAVIEIVSPDSETLWRREIPLSMNINEIEIPASQLQPGLYFLRVRTDKMITNKKLWIRR